LTKAKCTLKQVSLLREDSLASQMSKPQLLKRKWSEATDPKRADGSRKSAKAVAKARESARQLCFPKAAKAAKVVAFGYGNA
jgi:hypothetical protein